MNDANPVGATPRRRRDYKKTVAERHLGYILEVLRSTPRAPVRAAFADAGLDYERVRSEPSLLGTPYPYRLLHRLNLDECCPGICLRFGMARDARDHGVFGYAMLSCPSLRAAIQLMIKFHRLVTEDFDVDVTVDGRWAAVHARIKPESEWRVVIEEDHVTGIWRLLCSTLRPKPNPADVHIELTHDEPSYSELYHELIGCKPEFSRPESFVAFPKSWLVRPVQGADETVSQVCELQCDQLLQELQPGDELVNRVRRTLVSLPRSQSPKRADIAKSMAMSTRTLERRLNDAGTSFKRIRNEVRMWLADHYLSTGLSVEDIASLTGYSQTAAFYRAFRSWHGMTPKEYQSRLKADKLPGASTQLPEGS